MLIKERSAGIRRSHKQRKKTVSKNMTKIQRVIKKKQETYNIGKEIKKNSEKKMMKVRGKEMIDSMKAFFLHPNYNETEFS
jgi:hypothetical protein